MRPATRVPRRPFRDGHDELPFCGVADGRSQRKVRMRGRRIWQTGCLGRATWRAGTVVEVEAGGRFRRGIVWRVVGTVRRAEAYSGPKGAMA